MTNPATANHASGIMSRRARNQKGNIIAVLAAAVIPVIGLVGGAVDMSRLYLTQARLQGACNAGALLGRKTMGVADGLQISARQRHKHDRSLTRISKTALMYPAV